MGEDEDENDGDNGERRRLARSNRTEARGKDTEQRKGVQRDDRKRSLLHARQQSPVGRQQGRGRRKGVFLVSVRVRASRDIQRPSDPSDAGTHEDFAPQYKPQGSVEKVSDVIEKDVKGSKIFVYMKGVPEAPQCGFSNMVCRILDAYGVEYGSRNVLEDMEVRQGVKDYTQWPTIPQIFVDGEFVGGCDILMEMHKSGELEEVLKE